MSRRNTRRSLARLFSWLSGTRIVVKGNNNALSMCDAVMRGCRIQVHGNDNRLEFGEGCRLWDLDLEVVGDGHRLFLGDNCAIRGGRWILEDGGCLLRIGAQTTMISDTIVASESCAIVIGLDCMFGASVDIRCSDGHAIYDDVTGKRINPPTDVFIGDHVWLGAGVQVLKGATIGTGSVVAARALVTRSLPAHCIATGIPAKAHRHGITWRRDRPSMTATTSN